MLRNQCGESRRSLIKKTATLGGLSLTTTPVIGSPNDELVQYVHFIKSKKIGPGEPKRSPIYRTMPKDEWDRRKAATKATNKINQDIRNKWGATLIRPFFTTLDDSPIHFGVRVDYRIIKDNKGNKKSPGPKLEEVRNKLPDEVTVEYNGDKFTSSVKVNKSASQQTADCGESVNDMGGELWKDNVPGGVPCYADGRGSFCASFYETDYSGPGLITSGHVAGEIGNNVYQNSTHIGDVFDLTNNNQGVDWAFVRLSGPYSPEYYIADESNNNGDLDYTVDGIVTDEGLMADVDTNEIYYTQGRESRRESGTLGEMGVNDRYGGDGYNDVKSAHDVGDGDSGGPLFRIDSSSTGAYIGGVVYAKFTYWPFDNNCGNCLSTTAETVEEDAPGFFH